MLPVCSAGLMVAAAAGIGIRWVKVIGFGHRDVDGTARVTVLLLHPDRVSEKA